MRSEFPHRLALRMTTREREMLDALKGFRYCFDASSIVRRAICDLYATMQAERGSGLNLDYLPKLGPPVSDTAQDLSVVRQPDPPSDEATPPVKAKPKRRAPGPKPEDNHRPKKGASNANGKRVQRRPAKGKGSAPTGRPKPAGAKPAHGKVRRLPDGESADVD